MSEFNKVIGYEDIKLELARFCDVLKNPEIYEELGVTMPRGILLHGDPGLGKTLMARCFIAESGCKVFTLRKEKPNGDFVNQIKETFEKAKEESPVIVFLDDMDKFANEDNMHRDAEEYVTVQSCIDDCKEYKVFTLATANKISCLPNSLLRAGRFDKVIEMEAPRGEEALQIIKHYLGKKRTIGDIDVVEISRLMEGQSCAELETVINEAGVYAGFDGRSVIEQKDIVKSCMRMIFGAPECIEGMDDKHKRLLAVHEAGHAIISEILEPGSVSIASICKYRGASEGIIKFREPIELDQLGKLKEQLIMRGLGGKAAIEVVYGETDLGCNTDMCNVFDIMERLVDDSCAYGFDSFERNSISNYLLEKKDRTIASEMDRLYKQAKKILIENRDFFDDVVENLIEKETITYRDMEIIRRKLQGMA